MLSLMQLLAAWQVENINQKESSPKNVIADGGSSEGEQVKFVLPLSLFLCFLLFFLLIFVLLLRRTLYYNLEDRSVWVKMERCTMALICAHPKKQPRRSPFRRENKRLRKKWLILYEESISI